MEQQRRIYTCKLPLYLKSFLNNLNKNVADRIPTAFSRFRCPGRLKVIGTEIDALRFAR